MVILALILTLPSPIAHMDSLFYDGRYAELIAYADSVARSDTGLVRLEALKFTAFAYVALDSSDRAVEAFKRLLAVNPYFNLDPIYTFPGAYRTFQRAQSELKIENVPSMDSIKTLLHIIDDHERKRRLRGYSLVMPGLAQIRYGQKARGKRIMAGFLLSVAAWGLTNYAYLRSKEAYMEAREPSSIQKTYRTMDIWYKLRLISAVSAIGIYVYAQVSF